MDGCQVAKLSWLASLGSAPMNHSRVSSRRGRKPSQGRGERFKRGSATQFDRRNSNGGAVGELRQPFPQPSDHEGETKGILWPGQSVNDRR